MGRKGVSKRKSPKPKNSPVSNTNSNGGVSSLAHVSEAQAPRVLGKGEAISISKGGKKKSSDSRQNNRKR